MVVRAIAYARGAAPDGVSDGSPGIKEQFEIVRAEIDERGWELHAEIADEEASNAAPPPQNRTGLEPALDSLVARDADVLVVSSLDRISRDLSVWAELVESAQLAGWGIVAVADEFDFADRESGLMIRSIVACLQVGQGTDGTPRPRRGRPVKHSPEARRLVVDRHEAGDGLTDIARRLTREGIPTATEDGRWHASTVRSILNTAQLDTQAVTARSLAEIQRLEKEWMEVADDNKMLAGQLRSVAGDESRLPADPRIVPDAPINIAISNLLADEPESEDRESLQARIDRLKTALRKELVELKKTRTRLDRYIREFRGLNYTAEYNTHSLAMVWLEMKAVEQRLAQIDRAKYGQSPATAERERFGHDWLVKIDFYEDEPSFTVEQSVTLLPLDSLEDVEQHEDGTFTVRRQTTLVDPARVPVDPARIEAYRQIRLARRVPTIVCPKCDNVTTSVTIDDKPHHVCLSCHTARLSRAEPLCRKCHNSTTPIPTPDGLYDACFRCNRAGPNPDRPCPECGNPTTLITTPSEPLDICLICKHARPAPKPAPPCPKCGNPTTLSKYAQIPFFACRPCKSGIVLGKPFTPDDSHQSIRQKTLRRTNESGRSRSS